MPSFKSFRSIAILKNLQVLICLSKKKKIYEVGAIMATFYRQNTHGTVGLDLPRWHTLINRRFKFRQFDFCVINQHSYPTRSKGTKQGKKKIYNHEVVKCMNQFAPIQNSTLYASDNPLYVSILFPLLFQFSDWQNSSTD